MSLAKSVPKILKPRECERTQLREPLPIPYIPEEDKVQEEVARLRNLQIKTSLEKNTTLNFPIWHENGTKEAFLMHVTAVVDAIKKCGHFKDYEKAKRAYDEAKQAIESAKEGLALLDRTSGEKKKMQEEGTREGQGSRNGSSKESHKGSPCKGSKSQVRSQGTLRSAQGEQQHF
jgi:hypothetical protein